MLYKNKFVIIFSVDEYKGTVDYITEDESEDEEPGTVFQKMSIKYKFLQIPRKVTWERSPMCDENNNCLCASVGKKLPYSFLCQFLIKLFLF